MVEIITDVTKLCNNGELTYFEILLSHFLSQVYVFAFCYLNLKYLRYKGLYFWEWIQIFELTLLL